MGVLRGHLGCKMPKHKSKREESGQKPLFDTAVLTQEDYLREEIPLEECTVYDLIENNGDRPFLCRKEGLLFEADSLSWLKGVKSDSIDVVFADPPYNIKKARWDLFSSQEEYIEWSMKWITECARVLKPTGTLFICGFTEILADLKHPATRYFDGGCRWLIWYYKNKANLGNDWGRSHESILLLRKSKQFVMNTDSVRIPYNAHTLRYPSHPQAVTSQYGQGRPSTESWTPDARGAKPKDVIEIPTTCNGMGEKTPHPTQKPEELLRKIILASSHPGDVILDPFSGSGTTLVAAQQLGRRWIGCEMNPTYNTYARDRIDSIVPKTVEEWMAYDRLVAERRNKIR